VEKQVQISYIRRTDITIAVIAQRTILEARAFKSSLEHSLKKRLSLKSPYAVSVSELMVKNNDEGIQ
jgi:hypothetical protein